MSNKTPAFGSKDTFGLILDYADKNCQVLTNDYLDCVPPFRYHNSQNKKKRDCSAECFANVDKWLTPLLQASPTKLQVNVKDYIIRGTIDYTNAVLTITQFGSKQVYVAWIEKQDLQYFKDAKDTYFPESFKQAGVMVKDLLHKMDKPSLVLELFHTSAMYGEDGSRFFLADGNRGTATIEFPGNAIWQRFARHVKGHHLTIQFSL